MVENCYKKGIFSLTQFNGGRRCLPDHIFLFKQLFRRCLLRKNSTNKLQNLHTRNKQNDRNIQFLSLSVIPEKFLQNNPNFQAIFSKMMKLNMVRNLKKHYSFVSQIRHLLESSTCEVKYQL